MTKKNVRYTLVILCFVAVVTFLHTKLHDFSMGHMPFMNSKSKYQAGSYRLHFPRNFPSEVSIEELIKNTPAFGNSGYRYSRLIKTAKTPDFNRGNGKYWTTSMLRIFGFRNTIGLNLKRCSETLVSNTTVAVSPKKNLNLSLSKVVARLVSDIEKGSDAYLREFAPFLLPQIRLQVKHRVVENYWFNMAGSSVFLKEYGYHMMFSRLAYSSVGLRDSPQFSFVYTQLYDTDWNEVNDIALIVPTNLGEGDRFFSVSDQHYTIAHYPSMVQVPVFHDHDHAEMLYLGPEDARVILVKNAAGYEEPLLVYNMEHKKYEFVDDDEDEYIFKQSMLFRSMWISWPWQFQRGKFAVEDDHSENFDSQLYTRVKELRIKNMKREKKQKNWTPLVSERSRIEFGFDKYLFFVYRWAHLSILKCDITSENDKCGFTYTSQENMKVTSQIGALRGGTPMANLNSIIGENSDISVAEMMPDGREVWVGFARAHFIKCGCGNDFYRPNLVVLVKDTIIDEFGVTSDIFRLSHVSSFTTFNVEAIPWDPLHPLDLCKGTNAIIPNAISEWKVREIKKKAKEWIADDILSLALSVSDCTVDLVHISGLLNVLMNMPDHYLFLNPSTDINFREDSLRRMQDAQSGIQSTSNDNLVCAMEDSFNFCAFYGKVIHHRKVNTYVYSDRYDVMEKYAKLHSYNKELAMAI